VAFQDLTLVHASLPQPAGYGLPSCRLAVSEANPNVRGGYRIRTIWPHGQAAGFGFDWYNIFRIVGVRKLTPTYGLIPFGVSGYIVLFEIEDKETVTILAARHQREEDYH